MTKILYLKDVANSFYITMDTIKEHVMLLNMGNKRIMKFRECGDGPYYFYTPGKDKATKNMVSNKYLIFTVAKKNLLYLSIN